MKQHVIGIDFGTLSARAVILDALSGEEIAEHAVDYPHGVLDLTLPSGEALKDQSALQDPNDYLFALSSVIPTVLDQANLTPDDIAGICIDFTTCTMLPIDADDRPLRDDPRFAHEPHAWVKLWKHHASQPQADRITALAASRGEAWLPLYGDKISSEWMLPKILEILEDSPEIFEATDRFIEAADWLSLLLTDLETHAPGLAALKANYAPDLGFPSDDFLTALDPRLSGLYGTRLSGTVNDIREIAGVLGERGARLTGLRVGTPLALPMLDAGAAMPALGITGEREMMMILGTSGVLLIHDRMRREVPGICGCIKEGLLPGYYTYEAGLAALGDAYDWFVKNCVPASYQAEADRRGISIHTYLSELASREKVGQSGLLALDWLCGNRSVLKDADLSGMILGLTLTTRPEQIYRALIEATAFGMRRAMEAYEKAGMPIDSVCAAGGIARKNPMLMQIYADVFGCEIRVPSTLQAAAHGAGIWAAWAAGIYPTVTDAIRALSSPPMAVYRPIPEHREGYILLYEEYKKLHDYFGCGDNPIMKTLSVLRKQ